MTATLTDRIYGESSGVAVKAPCLSVSVGAPLPLVGLGAVGGYVPNPGDRILVKDQVDPTANGIYNASAGAWQRSGDFNGSYDCVQGTLIVVYFPNGGATMYQLTTVNPIIGTTPLNFSVFLNPSSTNTPVTPAEGAAGSAVINGQYLPGVIERYNPPFSASLAFAFQAAINQAKIGGGADVIVGTTGVTLLDAPIDMTTPVGTTRYAVTVRGVRNLQATSNNSPYYGTILLRHTGIAFDNTGCTGVNFENLSIGTDPVIYPKIGFLLARNTDASSAPDVRFRNVQVLGNFHIAPLYNYGIEDDEYYGCQFWNFAQDFSNGGPNTGSKAMVFTGTNYLYGVTSTFTAILGAGANHGISTQDHKFFGGTYYSNRGSPNLSNVQITGIAGQFSCNAANFYVGQPIAATGVFGGTGSITGYTSPTVYFVSATNGTTAFTLVSAAGAALVTTVGTTTGLTFAAQSSDAIYIDSVNNFRMYAPWSLSAQTGLNPGRSFLYIDLKQGPSNGITIDALMLENQTPNQQNFGIFVGNEAAQSSSTLMVRGGLWSANVAQMYNSAASNYFLINWFNNPGQNTPSQMINDGTITAAFADTTLFFSAGAGTVSRNIGSFAYPVSIQSPGDGYLSLQDPIAAANAKIWNVRSTGGNFAITLATDGNVNSGSGLQATRTGTTVTGWQFAGKLYAPQDNGSQQSIAGMFGGAGAPNNANGNNGDFYLRGDTPATANQRLYVKSAGAWVGII